MASASGVLAQLVLTDNRLKPLHGSHRTELVVLSLHGLGQELLLPLVQDLVIGVWRHCFSHRNEIASIIDPSVQGHQHLTDLIGILVVQRFCATLEHHLGPQTLQLDRENREQLQGRPERNNNTS
jgi:hypothetical protein